jgi:phage terminase large subunit-like protein
MVFGESGILACSPPDRRPEWNGGRRLLTWPNGAQAQVFSAFDPESLRGPQFDGAWADELAKWGKGRAAWDMLQFALRLGERPRQVVTTTPQGSEVLRELLDDPAVAVSRAATEANRAGLAAAFLEEIRQRYAGSRLARQELDGEYLGDVEGALWTAAGLDACRQRGPLPEFSRIVVAVDPPGSGKAGSDECGIVVVGAMLQGPVQDWRAVVLEDASVQGARPRAGRRRRSRPSSGTAPTGWWPR